jgi:hypothetical protein
LKREIERLKAKIAALQGKAGECGQGDEEGDQVCLREGSFRLPLTRASELRWRA